MVWGAPNFFPKNKLMKLNFSRKMVTCIFLHKNAQIKKPELNLFAMQLLSNFSDHKAHLKYFQKTEGAPYI